MNPTQKIIDFITGHNLSDTPLEALEKTKASIMDYTGVTLAGTADQASAIVRKTIREMGGAPQSGVWGSDLKTSAGLAALANGTAAHALDYDDTNQVMMAHPSIQLLPALFALGEYRHAKGEDIILAYVIGFEVGARLGKTLNPYLVAGGWFPVGPLGTMMQTAANSRLMGLNQDQVKMALGIAASLASGLRCNSGTMAKPLVAGTSASNSILAVSLAAEGMTANQNVLEDQFGFVQNFGCKDKKKLETEVESLGEHFEMLDTGMSYKLYPCCAGTHTSIDCVLDILTSHPINPDDIEEIKVSVSSGVKFLLIHPRPKTVAEAKFSLEYCVARAILDGDVGQEQFTSSKITDATLQSLINKVKPDYQNHFSAAVEIEVIMKDGKIFSSQAEQARGMPGSPLNWEELEQKFRQCAGSVLLDGETDSALEQLKHFEQVNDVAEFVAPFLITKT
jgi:2-methylcitrate dehydratase PrpD